MRRPENPPDVGPLLAEPAFLRDAMQRRLGPEVLGLYLPWDEVRRRKPPAGLDVLHWWAELSLARQLLAKPLPIVDAQAQPFYLVAADEVQLLLHEIDRHLGGRIELPDVLSAPEVRDRYVLRGLVEEAITSSQLEGASTTRREAKEMLRNGRAAATPSERMILNNYHGMELVLEHHAPLTPAFILELHEVLTRGTMDDADVGRLRRADEVIHVADNADGTVVHVPPPASLLDAQLQALCDFANGSGAGPFIHPVVRAILLHFWLAYLHPFVDGNGRTARALFYGSVNAKRDYWLVRFLSISQVIKKAPAQYGRAFLYSEAPGNDATYFVVHQLKVIQEAIAELVTYVERKVREVREAERRLDLKAGLNHRQRALLAHALQHPGSRYTIEAHRRSHAVVYQTARADLLELKKRGFLKQVRGGRKLVFEAAKAVLKRRSPKR